MKGHFQVLEVLGGYQVLEVLVCWCPQYIALLIRKTKEMISNDIKYLAHCGLQVVVGEVLDLQRRPNTSNTSNT
jgi:hypothetical protein